MYQGKANLSKVNLVVVVVDKKVLAVTPVYKSDGQITTCLSKVFLAEAIALSVL